MSNNSSSSRAFPSYDRALKRVFAHPIMMESLIKAFVRQDWTRFLDFSSLEQVNVKHTTEELQTRENDLIWKINFKGQPLYIICLLEFQSTIDHFMAVRILTYVGLIYQEIIQQKHTLVQKKLPPVFSLVFYTGLAKWNAPLSLNTCLSTAIPKGLMSYQPNIEYMLLDVGHIDLIEHPLAPSHHQDNLAVQLVELESAKQISDSVAILDRLTNLLRDPKFDNLRRDIFVYIKRALKLQKRFPEIPLEGLSEANVMLSERMDQWEKEFLERGRQEGVIEGREMGLVEGIRQERLDLLNDLLQIHSSPVLNKLKAKLPLLSNEELKQWINKLTTKKVESLVD